MIRALLIEDEAPAREDFHRLIASHPDVTIVGEAASVSGARKLLAAPGYDLVFLDIQLIGGTGFDLVPLVSSAARIIFVTAYHQHAIRAFEVNALDYLLKPVAPARLAAALGRLTTPAAPDASPPPPPPPPPLTKDDHIFLQLGSGRRRLVRLADIRLVASCENYSNITLGGGEHLLVRMTMKSWERVLPSAEFIRVHRQTIVNLAHIIGLERMADSSACLRLDGLKERVPVSYRSLPALRGRLPDVRH